MSLKKPANALWSWCLREAQPLNPDAEFFNVPTRGLYVPAANPDSSPFPLGDEGHGDKWVLIDGSIYAQVELKALDDKPSPEQIIWRHACAARRRNYYMVEAKREVDFIPSAKAFARWLRAIPRVSAYLPQPPAS